VADFVDYITGFNEDGNKPVDADSTPVTSSCCSLISTAASAVALLSVEESAFDDNNTVKPLYCRPHRASRAGKYPAPVFHSEPRGHFKFPNNDVHGHNGCMIIAALYHPIKDNVNPPKRNQLHAPPFN